MKVIRERRDLVDRWVIAYFAFAQVAGAALAFLPDEGVLVTLAVAAVASVTLQAGVVTYYLSPKGGSRWPFSFFLFFSNAVASITAGFVFGLSWLDGAVAFVIVGAGWLVTTIIGVLGAAGSFISSRVFNYVRRFPEPDECPCCGYNLTGNTSGRCPECGEQPLEAWVARTP
ncbi:MAG: hypothetical protein CHACPFDD_00461 [Phycisphaerae bacterium]|nr:hypothetical protein [Phycisphaerae bacterium]